MVSTLDIPTMSYSDKPWIAKTIRIIYIHVVVVVVNNKQPKQNTQKHN